MSDEQKSGDLVKPGTFKDVVSKKRDETAEHVRESLVATLLILERSANEINKLAEEVNVLGERAMLGQYDQAMVARANELNAIASNISIPHARHVGGGMTFTNPVTGWRG